MRVPECDDEQDHYQHDADTEAQKRYQRQHQLRDQMSPVFLQVRGQQIETRLDDGNQRPG